MLAGEKELEAFDDKLSEYRAAGLDFDDYLHIKSADISDNQAEAVVALASGGVTINEGIDIINSFEDITPTNGRKNVSSIQKAEILAGACDDPKVQLKAVKSVLDDSTYDKFSLAYEEFNVWPEVYIEAKIAAENLAYKTKGNTNLTQEIVKRVLDKMDLYNGRKAVLWQFLTGDKPDNNPYNYKQGKWAYDALQSLKDD